MPSVPFTTSCFLLLWGIVSCALPSTGGRVPVEGNLRERAALSGQWSGRYWSHGVRRRGIIRFSLGERADSGRGEVEITFSPALSLAQGAASVDRRNPMENQDGKPRTLIDLSIVQVEASRVRGTTVFYWDPDCDCRARTEFEGTLSNSHITGTFTVRREAPDNRMLTGHWLADRQPS